MKKRIILLALLLGGIVLGGYAFHVHAQSGEEDVGPLDHIVIAPFEAFLEKGSGQQFHAHAYDADGNMVDCDVVWAT